MRVCLLNLPWELNGRDGIRAGCRFPNLTPRRTNRYVPFPFLLAHTASYLESRGVEVLLIDGCAERCTPHSMAQRIAEFAPDLIVAETSTTSLVHDKQQLVALAKLNPTARIAVYGPHTDVRPEDALTEPAIDFVLQGEPEHTTHALLGVLQGHTNPADVLGLVWRAGDGGAVVNRRRPALADLDALPFPRRTGLPMGNYNVPGFPSPVAFVYAGRGCPYQCSFCLWPQTTLQGGFRPRSPARLVDEMNAIVQAFPATRSFFFDDDTFNISRDFMVEFADELERRGPGLPWGCNARADHWDREILARLAQVGLFTLRFGLESGDPEVLGRTGKNLNLDEARRTLEMSAAAGIENHIMFVIGLPGETRDSVGRTLRFIASVPYHSVQFSVATPFPGTRMYREAEAKGHLVTHEWEQYSGFDHVVMRTDALTADEVGQQLARARRRVYFSLRFIRRRLRYVRDIRDLPALARKALRLLTSAGFDRV